MNRIIIICLQIIIILLYNCSNTKISNFDGYDVVFITEKHKIDTMSYVNFYNSELNKYCLAKASLPYRITNVSWNPVDYRLLLSYATQDEKNGLMDYNMLTNEFIDLNINGSFGVWYNRDEFFYVISHYDEEYSEIFKYSVVNNTKKLFIKINNYYIDDLSYESGNIYFSYHKFNLDKSDYNAKNHSTKWGIGKLNISNLKFSTIIKFDTFIFKSAISTDGERIVFESAIPDSSGYNQRGVYQLNQKNNTVELCTSSLNTEEMIQSLSCDKKNLYLLAWAPSCGFYEVSLFKIDIITKELKLIYNDCNNVTSVACKKMISSVKP